MIVLVSLLLAGTSMAATRKYPGAAPCDTTLQKCIDKSKKGDVILLDVDSVDSSLTINKSLTLQPVPGRKSTLIGGGLVTKSIAITEGADPVVVVINQLQLENAYISITFQNTTGNRVFISNSSINVSGGVVPGGIDVQLGGASSATIVARNNTIQASGYPVRIQSGGISSQIKLIGNWITSPSATDSKGGIRLDASGSSMTGVEILSNVIYDVGGCAGCGDTPGVGINYTGTSTGMTRIINNTIDAAQGDGIQFYFPTTPQSQAVMYVHNNIVTNPTGSWIELPAMNPNVLVFTDYNTYFGAFGTYGGYVAGGSDVYDDPEFVDAANHDYNLQFTSPCLNGGSLNAYWPSDFRNVPRPLGNNPDRGAIERTSSFLQMYLLFGDFFSDETIADQYDYVSGSWKEDGYSLIGSSSKAAKFLVGSTNVDCSLCSVNAHVRTAGQSGTTKTTKVSLLGWYSNSKNYVELSGSAEKDVWTLRQVVNGVTVQSDSFSTGIDPNVDYALSITYDGANFSAMVDHDFWNTLTIPSTGSPNGTVGFKTKGTTGYLLDLFVSD